MDGFELERSLREIIQEDSGSAWINSRTSYDYLYQAVCRFVERTECITATQTITTVASTSTYDLNADFMGLYLNDRENRYYIKYNDGVATTDYIIYHRDYEAIVFEQNTTPVSVPDRFSIKDNPTQPSIITGTTTSAGAAANGECTLTNTGGLFTTTNKVTVGDQVHNTTDGSHGIVIAVTSASALVTTLFEGTNNDWTSGDAYVIVPQSRLQLVLDPPSLDATGTITINYIQRPAPVYSPYRTYRIQSQWKDVLVGYAAFLYKYRDREPNFGDRFYRAFDTACRSAARSLNKQLRREGMRVSYIKRAFTDSSYK